MTQVWKQMAQEQATERQPMDNTRTSQLRWALLHGESFTAREAADRFDVLPMVLAQVARQLREAGFDIDQVTKKGEHLRMRVKNLDHVPGETRKKAEVAKRAGNGHDAVAELRHFHRPPPAVLPLGTVVRVVMVAEDNGHAAVVLKDMVGNQWFAHVDTPA